MRVGIAALLSTLPMQINTDIRLGDCRQVLQQLANYSVGLIFTSLSCVALIKD